jgi:hypothetical protein
MKKFFLIIVVLVVLFACNKDKFQTKPQITIKSYNAKEFAFGSTMEIRLSYTDKEGDIGQGAFYGLRERLNSKPLTVADNDKADTLKYNIPEMAAKADKGELVMTLGYDFLKESNSENDTLVFKIAITDIAGHASDTLTTDKLVILK